MRFADLGTSHVLERIFVGFLEQADSLIIFKHCLKELVYAFGDEFGVLEGAMPVEAEDGGEQHFVDGREPDAAEHDLLEFWFLE